MTANSPLKQFLLAALETPQRSYYPTKSDAHRARFAFYNGLRQLRRAHDEWGETKDLLEAVVQPAPNGTWELRIQRKSTELMDILKQSGFVPQQPPPSLSPQDQELLRLADLAQRRVDAGEYDTPQRFDNSTRLRDLMGRRAEQPTAPASEPAVHPFVLYLREKYGRETHPDAQKELRWWDAAGRPDPGPEWQQTVSARLAAELEEPQ